jgi:hypothetical protein
LGIVVWYVGQALAEKAAHVPFRDSKLTRLLQQSLGGNSRTSLIICCASELKHAPETVSTLRSGFINIICIIFRENRKSTTVQA